MRSFVFPVALASLAVLASPAAAAPKPATTSKSPMGAMTPPNLDAMMSVFDKLRFGHVA